MCILKNHQNSFTQNIKRFKIFPVGESEMSPDEACSALQAEGIYIVSLLN